MMSAVLALAAGLLVGWLATKAHADRIRADLIEERRELDIALSAARQQLSQEAHWRDECELLNNELRSLHSINTSLEADLREVTTRLEATQQHAEDKIRQMINSEQRLSEQFENLANRIFEHSNRRVDEQNRQSLNSLLAPLREQLDGFRRRVQDSFGKEAQERHTLAHEIRNLQQLNAQMAQEAVNLTRALKAITKRRVTGARSYSRGCLRLPVCAKAMNMKPVSASKTTPVRGCSQMLLSDYRRAKMW